ncbi:RNA polymerase sigma factor [Brotaphodocola sp.]|uniref:RNA polymerase sigma factor n=1 Tax=Brotaphodocola sp. TaxID=3073577 RepID=UPI003D7D8B0A
MSMLSLELSCPPGGFDFLRSLKKFLSVFHAKIYRYASGKKRLARQESLAENAGYILDTYGNSILRLAYSYVHNMSDAEDLLQDTLISYLDSAPSFENEAHEKAWLLKVAANLSKNRIAYNRLRMTDELDEKLIDEKKDDLSFVWEAVKNLPDKYREAIHLFYYEGYSTAEIAKILGRKESTIRSDLRRGRAELRFILKEVYDFE